MTALYSLGSNSIYKELSLQVLLVEILTDILNTEWQGYFDLMENEKLQTTSEKSQQRYSLQQLCTHKGSHTSISAGNQAT